MRETDTKGRMGEEMEVLGRKLWDLFFCSIMASLEL